MTETPTLKQLNDAINEHRKRLGWSQNKLADKARLGRATISRLLKGHQTLKYEHIWKIANALGVDPTHLAQLAGVPTIKPPIDRDPTVEYLAQKLDALPDFIREDAVEALGAQLDAIYRLFQLQDRGRGKLEVPIAVHLTQVARERFPKDMIKPNELRMVKSQSPGTYDSFLSSLLGPYWRLLVKELAELESDPDDE